MEDVAASLLLLCGSLILGPAAGSGSGLDPERGRMELRRVQSLAAQPRYGGCWARALEHLDTCRDMTSESQSRLALRFTHCHLSSSGRDFPSCPEGSEVSRCTAGMDPVAFNTYTEFFTHTHSICHFLQSEAWQSRAESTMYRLTEASAGVAEQLQSTRQMANELMEAQSVALQAQKEILSNGEELRATLRDSSQGVQAVFSDLSSASRQQQVALSQLFQRLSFLQSFLLMEAHSLTSCCYNAAALCTVYLITSTPCSSRARLLLLALVCVNFYLEKKIYQHVLSSDQPEHLHVVGRLTWGRDLCGGSWSQGTLLRCGASRCALPCVFCCWCVFATETRCSRAWKCCSSSERRRAACRRRCGVQRGLHRRRSWRTVCCS
ncbi:uncharacterized protein LOC116723031 isoform X3 [Xiphophorus hellerii]|uniref:uncharacterized protein LOC116723031 isoform X3 n=1 Tax=Xiphophorus hellerii TaxID=8084 RepID=UPI0013B3FC80|nr:uncharacterized protein LOC116723031 isoform X3 [Xiphophorus hellerii]